MGDRAALAARPPPPRLVLPPWDAALLSCLFPSYLHGKASLMMAVMAAEKVAAERMAAMAAETVERFQRTRTESVRVCRDLCPDLYCLPQT